MVKESPMSSLPIIPKTEARLTALNQWETERRLLPCSEGGSEGLGWDGVMMIRDRFNR